MSKMDKKWVVLCSSAVAAIYASGYFTTENQAAALNQVPKQTLVQNKAGDPTNHHTNRSNQNDQSSSPNTQSSNQSSTTQSTSTQSKNLYKDGTYKGTGMNRRGYIEVTVAIKNGKVNSVDISQFDMHYSESDIDGLPQEVVKIQSAQVQNVTGATYSTMAFEDAVQQALSQAKNA